jgi:hypothetical protein
MDKNGTLVLRQTDLPLTLTLEGENGEREYYTIAPAGRKFGAFLQKVTGLLRDKLMQQ